MSKNLNVGAILSIVVVVLLLVLSVFALSKGFNFSEKNTSSSSSVSSLSQSSKSVSSEALLVLDSNKNLVENASNIPEVSTVYTAIVAADLGGALSSDGPFTVFLPSNTAFEKLPEGKVSTLLELENKEILTNLLKYHVVPGLAKSSDLTNGQVLSTLSGQKLTVEIMEGSVKLIGENDSVVANVIYPDLTASNGVVHVIDTVLTE